MSETTATEVRPDQDAQYLDLFQHGPVAYFSVDSDGRIRLANERAAELTGYDRDCLEGMPVLDLYADDPDGRAKAERLFERFLAGEVISGEELQWRRADGSVVWIRLWVRPMRGHGGGAIASRSVAVDITEIRRAEREREEAVRQKEEAIQTKQRFLSMLTHELRNPLASMKGFTALLTARWDDLPPSRRRELVERAAGATDRMDRLVEEFLQIAQQEGVQPRLERLDLTQLVDSVMEALDASQEVQVDLPRRVMVRADRLLTQQILINLLVNAARHGNLPTMVTGELDGETARVVVRDHGPGVSEAFRPRLFERFARQDSTTSGSGLGLAISRELARAQGGELTHEPASPGARFVLHLPHARSGRIR